MRIRHLGLLSLAAVSLGLTGCYSVEEYRGPGEMWAPEYGPDYAIILPTRFSSGSEDAFTMTGLPSRSFEFIIERPFDSRFVKNPPELPKNAWFDVTISDSEGRTVYHRAQRLDPASRFHPTWHSMRDDGSRWFSAKNGETYTVRVRGESLEAVGSPVFQTH